MIQNKKTDTKITILFSVFIISLSLFTYQVVLTRLYSAILSYHYVFLTTSFAILGLGIGSIWAYKDKARLKDIIGESQVEPDKIMAQINRGAFVLSGSYIAVFILIYIQPFVNNLMVYIILGIIPFIICGYLYSILFRVWPEVSGKIYFADLIGSGVGSIVIVSLLDYMGMFKTVVLICILPFIVSFILPAKSRRLKAVEYLLPVLLIAGLFLPIQSINTIETNFYALLNNSGKSYGNMKRAKLSPEIVYSKWNSFSRTDLIKLEEDPSKMVLTIDGSANAPMYKFDGDIASLGKFKTDNGFIPFTMDKNNKTLLIGVGGGRDVLYALAGGSKDISAVEINTASNEAVKAFGDYNGNLYNRPEVKVYGDDGRNFVRNTMEKYDLIYLSLVMTNTTQGVGYALSENYIYTVEAMEDYWERLTDSGKIAFLAHDQEDISKLAATAIQALVNKGIPLQDTPKYIALFSKLESMKNGATHIVDPVIIIKNKPFSEDESKSLAKEISERNAIPIFLPYLFEEGIISRIKNNEISLDQYINSFNRKVEPATDDNPYFYNFNKGIPAVLLLILVLCIISSVLLFASVVKKKGNFQPSAYFGLLGMGFMMIEIPFIQKFILYLGHPTLAFSYILAAMLIGCGIGGFLSNNKIFSKTLGKIYLPPIMVAIINICLLLSLDYIFQKTSGLNITSKIIVASFIVAIQGFFMGMPFPRGLKLLGAGDKKDLIPVMWGINGAMSVIGSVVSIILSMTFGFTAALIAGAIIYIAVGFFRDTQTDYILVKNY